MKIHEIIRKYRKEQNLTQEQVANYLGVSAPAVNKWENGISYPDITLLAPLARVLKINVDTLLSFKEELTDKEIDQFVKELSEAIHLEGYEAAFAKASDKIKEYPNCDKLILFSSQIMNAYLVMGQYEITEKEKCQKQIKAWFETVAFSSNQELANMAVMSLSQIYMVNGEYEEAQRLLDQIPPLGFDKRTTQATLYNKQGKVDKAFEIHETMLYQSLNSVISSLLHMLSLLCAQKDYETAIEYAGLIAKVAEQFDLGKYLGASAKVEVYMKLQDEEKSLDALEEMLTAGVESMKDSKNSKLYRHMTFKEDAGMNDIARMIQKGLEEDKDLDFLRENPRFKALLNRCR